MRAELWANVRLGARTLRRSTTFTVVAVIVLALGIGVSTGVFSAVDALLLRPLPYADAGRIAAVALQQPGSSISKQTFARLRERQHVFVAFAGWSRWGFMRQTPAGTDFVQGAVATADFFAVLGVRALIGRTFAAGDDTPGRGGVVVLSHEYWQRAFGGRRDVVGTPIRLNDASHTVIGVLPAGAGYPGSGVELWAAAVIDPGDSFDYASAGYLLPIGRLRPGISFATATSELRTLATALRSEFPSAYSDDYGAIASTTPLRETVLGSTRLVLLVSFGAVGLLLLVTCANVGNLVVARASARRHDVAVRRALGATARDVQQMIVVEMLLLGLIGGVGGILVAFGTTELIRSLLPAALPGVTALRLDLRAAGFAAVLSIIVGALCSVVPVWRSNSGDAQELRGGRQRTGDARTHRTMGVLLVVEAATAVVLATAAGLMLQTVWKLAHEPLGFNHRSTVAFTVVLPPNATTPERQIVFYEALLAEISRLPRIVATATASPLPFSGSNQTPAVSIDGAEANRGDDLTVDWRHVSHGYFAAMQIPLVRGRTFGASDHSSAPAVAVINETFARRHFAGRDAIGQRIRTVLDGAQWATVVGIVGDTKVTSVATDPPAQMYRPLAQRPSAFASVVVRTDGDVTDVLRSLPDVVRAADRNAVWLQARPVEEMLGQSYAQRRTLTTILTAFASLALLLGLSGVAALSAYRVAQRRREIAIRLALGAKPATVAGLVVSETLKLTLVGVVTGIVMSLAGTRLLTSQLHGVQSVDITTFTLVGFLMCVGAIVASWAPARLASQMDPASVMRDV